jgi:hypothetical protein
MRLLTYTDVVQAINDTLAEASPEFVADIANKILSNKVRYRGQNEVGDDEFEQEEPKT